MKKLFFILGIFVVSFGSAQGQISDAIDLSKKLFDGLNGIFKKINPENMKDYVATLELINQIACLKADFNLNYNLAMDIQGCNEKIAYALAVSKMMAATVAIAQYKKELLTGDADSLKDKLDRINKLLEAAIYYMREYDVTVSVTTNNLLNQEYQNRTMDLVGTYTISRY
jgi:hypothetical protein